jgi:hypothetical protein
MSSTTVEIEREVEATRDRMERTVDALKDRMSVGQILDDITHYAGRHGGRAIASNLAAQIKENPLPIALVGVGLAWLILGKGSRHAAYDPYAEAYGDFGADHRTGNGNGKGMGEKIRSAARGAGAALQSAAEGISSAAQGVADAARRAGEGFSSAAHAVGDTGHRVQDAMGRAADSTRHGFADAAGGARGGIDQARKFGHDVGEYGQRAARSAGDYFTQEPLVAGAIGLAVGAAIGALLPPTEMEDRLFGEARDKVADEAEKVAAEQFERAKETAAEVYQNVKSEAEQRLAVVRAG